MDLDQVIGAAVVTIVPLVMVWLARAGGLASVKPGEVRYSSVLRWFGLLAGGLPTPAILVIVVVMGTPVRPDERIALAGTLLLFAGLGVPLMVEFFRVRHAFDDAGLSFRSPWSRHRRIRWIDVSSIRWRKFAKWLDIKTHTGATVHLSPLLSGLKPFADTALARVPSAVLAADPTARAALQVMSAGAAGELLMSPLSPEALLASVTARNV